MVCFPWSIQWDGLISGADFPTYMENVFDFLLFGALVLKHLWSVRNDVVFEGNLSA